MVAFESLPQPDFHTEGRTKAQAARFAGRPPFLHLGRIPDGGIPAPPGPHAVLCLAWLPKTALGRSVPVLRRTARRGKPRSHAGLCSDFVHAATNNGQHITNFTDFEAPALGRYLCSRG